MFVEKLTSIGSLPISNLTPDLDGSNPELHALLMLKNGFFCFEGALQVFSTDFRSKHICLRDWNNPNLWRNAYGDMNDLDILFFAQDIFGYQFGLKDRAIVQFDPETGLCKTLADSMENWAQRVLRDFRVLTGFPIAHKWQVLNGSIAPNCRLNPSIPFVLGGAYTIDNLFAANMIDGMLARADIAHQIRRLPDGTKVEFIVDK